jgi:peptide/nickel transport system permease protein
LGFGIQPPTASWGNMLANAESNITIAPWVAIFPGLCILVSCSINYLGDGLRDALDPNMRQSSLRRWSLTVWSGRR